MEKNDNIYISFGGYPINVYPPYKSNYSWFEKKLLVPSLRDSTVYKKKHLDTVFKSFFIRQKYTVDNHKTRASKN